MYVVNILHLQQLINHKSLKIVRFTDINIRRNGLWAKVLSTLPKIRELHLCSEKKNIVSFILCLSSLLYYSKLTISCYFIL